VSNALCNWDNNWDNEAFFLNWIHEFIIGNISAYACLFPQDDPDFGFHVLKLFTSS